MTATPEMLREEVKKPCRRCGKEVGYGRSKFCSQECIKPIKRCVSCGLVLGFHKSKYCSDPCFRIGDKELQRQYNIHHQRKRKPVPKLDLKCVACGSQFQWFRNARFCSAKCRISTWAVVTYERYRKKLLPVPARQCQNCKISFTPKSRLQTIRFCSEKCRKLVSRRREQPKRQATRKTRYANDPAYRAKINKKASAWFCAKFKCDPVMRIKVGLRKRVRDMLHRKPTQSISALIGCSTAHLRAHLESQFTKGMAWNNYGSFWVVDHRIPLASFDIQNHEHRLIACHFTNLQPLTREANRIKSDSITDAQLPLRISPRSGVKEPARTPSDNRVPCSASG